MFRIKQHATSVIIGVLFLFVSCALLVAYLSAYSDEFAEIFMVPPSRTAFTRDRAITQSVVTMRINNIRSERDLFQHELAECETDTITGRSRDCITVDQNQIATDNRLLNKATTVARFYFFSIPPKD